METRKAVTAQIAAVIKEVSDKATSKRLVGLLRTLQMDNGGTAWLQPPGWDTQGLTKAGRDPNPWYEGYSQSTCAAKATNPSRWSGK